MRDEREKNRREMPETAKLIDHFTALFGAPRYFRLTENGRTVEWGKPLAGDDDR